MYKDLVLTAGFEELFGMKEGLEHPLVKEHVAHRLTGGSNILAYCRVGGSGNVLTISGSY